MKGCQRPFRGTGQALSLRKKEMMFRIIGRLTGIGVVALLGAVLLALGAGRVFAPTRYAVVFDQFVPGVGRMVHYVDPAYGLGRALYKGVMTVDPITPAATPEQVSARAFPVKGSVELFVVWPDGRQQQLTSPELFDSERPEQRYNAVPVWSPDGAWIAFVSSHGEGDMDVYVIRPDGGGLRLVAGDVGTLMPLRLRWADPAG